MMKILTFLMVFLATSALADADIRVNRIDMAVTADTEEVIEEAEEATAAAQSGDYNSSRSNNINGEAPAPISGDEAGTLKGQTRDAASGMPTGKRQHALDEDSDDDGLEVSADDCDDDCDSAVDVRKEVQKAKPAE